MIIFEGGHLLLVGLDGTGKRTTVQLAAKIAQCELYTLTITRNYGVAEFREELKTIFKLCGGSESRPIVFLVADNDLIMVTIFSIAITSNFDSNFLRFPILPFIRYFLLPK